MHFATLTLEVAYEIMPTTDFHQKFEKNKILHVFFKIIQYPFKGIFQINFCMRVPLNNTKNHFHKKKPRKQIFIVLS